jgi:hypothetical protein
VPSVRMILERLCWGTSGITEGSGLGLVISSAPQLAVPQLLSPQTIAMLRVGDCENLISESPPRLEEVR